MSITYTYRKRHRSGGREGQVQCLVTEVQEITVYTVRTNFSMEGSVIFPSTMMLRYGETFDKVKSLLTFF